MCGICGFTQATEQDMPTLKAMCDIIAHRGPDGEGQYIDDGIAFQCGNVTLPEIQPRLHGRQACNIGNTLCGSFALQIGVLHFQKIFICILRCANIHQAPQKLTLALRLCRNSNIPIFCFLFQKRLEQKQPPLRLIHSFSTAFTGQFS